MKFLSYLFGPIGCAVGMAAWMALMARGRRHHGTHPPSAVSEGDEAPGVERPPADATRVGAGGA